MTEREQQLEDLSAFMCFKLNRRVMWRIINQMSGIHRCTFSLETPAMAFNEGQRNIGLTMLADILEVCPDKLPLMMKEAKEVEHERKVAADAERERRRTAGELFD